MCQDISKIKFFITGGGTGGHIYPCVSVILELLSNGASKDNIYFIGNKDNLEYTIAKENGFNFLSTPIKGMPRKLSLKFLMWLFRLFVSILISIYYSIKLKPDVVFASGGYVSAPVLFAARLLNIPYILHDCDCVPGIVTRSFAKHAKSVNLAFLDAKKYINSKNIYNFNNPVRKDFFKIDKNYAKEMFDAKDKFLILIMGGSQGAKSINTAAKELILKYAQDDNVKIILQTGKKNYDEIVNSFKIPDNAIIKPYFDNMAYPIVAADLIVSRAGSVSISEILSSKNPSILIPYPYAAANHQKINADAVVKMNAALLVEDKDLEKGNLENTVDYVLSDKIAYQKLKENASILGKDFEFGTKNIVKLILDGIKK